VLCCCGPITQVFTSIVRHADWGDVAWDGIFGWIDGRGARFRRAVCRRVRWLGYQRR
jgi:hypothetical protein